MFDPGGQLGKPASRVQFIWFMSIYVRLDNLSLELWELIIQSHQNIPVCGKKTILTTYPALPVPESLTSTGQGFVQLKCESVTWLKIKCKTFVIRTTICNFCWTGETCWTDLFLKKIEWWSCDTKQAAKRYAVVPYKWINPVQLIVGRTECSPLKVVNFDSLWPKYCQTRFNDI